MIFFVFSVFIVFFAAAVGWLARGLKEEDRQLAETESEHLEILKKAAENYRQMLNFSDAESKQAIYDAISYAKTVVDVALLDDSGSSYTENKRIKDDRVDIIDALDKYLKDNS